METGTHGVRQFWRFFKNNRKVQPFAVGEGIIGSDAINPPKDGRDYFTGTLREAHAEAIRIAGILEAEEPRVTTPWGATIKINTKAA